MTNITDYADVRKRCTELGCHIPSEIALLPVNFATVSAGADLLQASESATIKKLLLSAGLPVNDLTDKAHRPPYIKNKAFEWIAPVLFVSASFYSQNPVLVSIALSVIANYATEFFKGKGGNNTVNLDVVVEKPNKTYKKITYTGPVDGLKDLAKVVEKVNNE